jgi:hypothetical protein
VLRIIKDCGIKYSRGVGAHHRFSVSQKWLEMDTTCHQADERVFELADQFVNGKLSNDWRTTEGWLFYIWGHSYEYRTEDDWARMENLCKILAGRDDVWYATNIELYDYIEAYRSLSFSVENDMVYNPSAYDVYMTHNGQKYCIGAGQTVKFQ